MKNPIKFFFLIMLILSILSGLTSCQKYQEKPPNITYQDTLHQRDTSNQCTLNQAKENDKNNIYYIDTKETVVNNMDNSSKDLSLVLIILNCVTIFISLILVLIVVFKLKT